MDVFEGMIGTLIIFLFIMVFLLGMTIGRLLVCPITEKNLIDMTCEELKEKYIDSFYDEKRTEILNMMILKKCELCQK